MPVRRVLLTAALLLALGCQAVSQKQSFFSASTPTSSSSSNSGDSAAAGSVWADLHSAPSRKTAATVQTARRPQHGNVIPASHAASNAAGEVQPLLHQREQTTAVAPPRPLPAHDPKRQQVLEVARLLTTLVKEDNGLLPSDVQPSHSIDTTPAPAMTTAGVESSRTTNTLAARHLAALVDGAQPQPATQMAGLATTAPGPVTTAGYAHGAIQQVSAVHSPGTAVSHAALSPAQMWELQRLAQETAWLSQRVDAMLQQQVMPAVPATRPATANATQADLQQVKAQLQQLLARMEQSPVPVETPSAAPPPEATELASVAAELALLAEKLNAQSARQSLTGPPR